MIRTSKYVDSLGPTSACLSISKFRSCERRLCRESGKPAFLDPGFRALAIASSAGMTNRLLTSDSAPQVSKV
jgi:hypothetical protein